LKAVCEKLACCRVMWEASRRARGSADEVVKIGRRRSAREGRYMNVIVRQLGGDEMECRVCLQSSSIILFVVVRDLTSP
jgi:hypothetical protein